MKLLLFLFRRLFKTYRYENLWMMELSIGKDDE